MIGGIKMYKKNQNWVTFNPNSAEYLFFAPFETIYYTVQLYIHAAVHMPIHTAIHVPMHASSIHMPIHASACTAACKVLYVNQAI